MAAAKEINVDAAVAAVLSVGWYFQTKRRGKKGTEELSLRTFFSPTFVHLSASLGVATHSVL